MRWNAEVNAFLARLSVISGSTTSRRTWRSYAYEFADWLGFCERTGMDWRRVTELDIATYRNILASESSIQTGRVLKRSTINHKLGVITQFYRFALKKGWITTLPFDLELIRIPCGAEAAFTPQRTACVATSLRLREAREELDIPPRQDIRRFVRSFRAWRDRLMAEMMWLTGMRNAEVCWLPVHALPDDPGVIAKETAALKIIGKGQKRRTVLFPVRLLCSVDRYIHTERARHIRGSGTAPSSVFVGRTGKPLKTSAVNRVFASNCRRTGLDIWPHLLRHAYSVERLAYLQEIGAPNPLKTVQMELGHASMAITERYLHVTERMRAEVIETHNSFVDRLLGD
ncbi:MAG: tyrosine-type recombinase/integrase [Candidatus Sulfopaludibacter sp.]|nr:tyrosine-type recombinase/integrase [Candidatus Sulfopaludibacter sp.]